MKKLINKTPLNRSLLFMGLAASGLGAMSAAQAAKYTIDSEGQHAFIQFKVSHLGYSYILGDFEDFTGEFEYDPENPNAMQINVNIETDSVDSSHAERDKHLRSEDFLHAAEYPTATFVSTSYTENEDGTGTLVGDFTLRGQTQSIEIETNKIGMGTDPWGGERIGFEGTTSFAFEDFGIVKDLGPTSKHVDLYLVIEGIKQ